MTGFLPTATNAGDFKSAVEALREKRGMDPGLPARLMGPDGHPLAVRDRFYVNAVYEGSVRKSFDKVGFGDIDYIPLERDHYQVKSRVELKNPQDDAQYQFKINMVFKQEGQKVSLIKSKNKYNEPSMTYSDEIEKAVPFFYFMKFLPPPGSNEEQSHRFEYGESRYVIRYRRDPNQIEATIYADDELVALGLIDPRYKDRFNKLNEVRVPEGDVMIRFMIQPPDAAGFYSED